MKAKPKKLLVVVDMQNWFMAVQPTVIFRVKKAIAAFRRHQVVFVEYEGHGSTVQELLDVVKKPNVISKTGQDGSKEVENWMTENGVPSEIHICGIETCHCVAGTANSLGKTYNVKVVADAISCSCAVFNKSTSLSCLKKLNVPIV